MEPWLAVDGGAWPYCYCPHILDNREMLECKTCEELIPGCARCEYSVERSILEVGVKVGWNPLLSTYSTLFLEEHREQMPQWVICKEGNNHTSVTVTLNKTEEMNILAENVPADELFELPQIPEL